MHCTQTAASVFDQLLEIDESPYRLFHERLRPNIHIYAKAKGLRNSDISDEAEKSEKYVGPV